MQKIIIGREYPETIIELVKQAQHSIKVLIYDWRWYSHDPHSKVQKFNNEILYAIRRGVKVSAVVNSRIISDILKSNGVDVVVCDSSKVMHIKMCVFDSSFVILGSHNLTMNAFEINHEMSILTDDQDSIKKCELFFDCIKK